MMACIIAFAIGVMLATLGCFVWAWRAMDPRT